MTGVARAQHSVQSLAQGFLEASTGMGDVMTKHFAEGWTADCTGVRRYLWRGGEKGCWPSMTSVALKDDVAVTNKVSQNLHAELLLHQVGLKVACFGVTTAVATGVVRGF